MKENTEKKKFTYEQLENIAHQLSEQLKQAHMKIYELNNENAFLRLDYLLRVIQLKDSFKPSFVQDCIDEVEEMMQRKETVKMESDK